jgi:hypothetical protein
MTRTYNVVDADGQILEPLDLRDRYICWISLEPVEGSPDMVRERLKGTSPATQRGVLAGGALAFYGMN